MRTLHTVVKRGALYWDRDLLPPSLYESRLDAIRARILAHGDAAWLLVGDVIRHGPVVYATNFMPRVRSALAFIPQEGAPVLFGNISSRDIPAARLITGIEDIRAFSRLPKELSTFLQEALPGGGRIGSCGVEDCLPATDWEAIEAALPDIVWAQRDDEIRSMRRRKDASEIEAIRRATALADIGLDRARDVARPGLSMRELVAELDRAARSRGAEDVRVLVASGAQTGVSLRPVDDRTLVAGDEVLLYCAVQHQRYWGEAAQMLVLGDATDVQRELQARAENALDAMMRVAVPGAATGALVQAAQMQLGAALDGALVYGLGHGIGLDAEESPVIKAEAADKLQDGDTLALRVVLHGADSGAIVARTVQVRSGGAVSPGQARELDA